MKGVVDDSFHVFWHKRWCNTLLRPSGMVSCCFSSLLCSALLCSLEGKGREGKPPPTCLLASFLPDSLYITTARWKQTRRAASKASQFARKHKEPEQFSERSPFPPILREKNPTFKNQHVDRVLARYQDRIAMAAARACSAVRFAFAEEAPPPETLDVVRRQRQMLRRAAAACQLDPISEETDELEQEDVPSISPCGRSGSTVHLRRLGPEDVPSISRF